MSHCKPREVGSFAQLHGDFCDYSEGATPLPSSALHLGVPGCSIVRLHLVSPSEHDSRKRPNAQLRLRGTASCRTLPRLMSGSRYLVPAPTTDAHGSESDSQTTKRPRLTAPVRPYANNAPPQPARQLSVCSIRGPLACVSSLSILVQCCCARSTDGGPHSAGHAWYHKGVRNTSLELSFLCASYKKWGQSPAVHAGRAIPDNGSCYRDGLYRKLACTHACRQQRGPCSLPCPLRLVRPVDAVGARQPRRLMAWLVTMQWGLPLKPHWGMHKTCTQAGSWYSA